MKRILSVILTAALLLPSITACSTTSNDLMGGITPNQKTETKYDEVSETAVTDFAVRLFKESMEEGKNTLISPLSVLIALSMTANGAREETLTQMEAVLGMPITELNSWVRGYMEKLPETEKYKLSIANSIWVKDDFSFEVEKDFLQTNADYYNAGIFGAPFDESTCREINQWVEDNTDGMIKDILDRIPAEAVMYLINALAFDAEWDVIYKENEIREGKFTKEDGDKQDAELMYSEENRYLEDKDAVGFIKYYKDQKYAFAALLPNEGVSVSDYITTLSGDKLNQLLSSAAVTPVDAAIPKFETGYKVGMNEILSHMGMPNAFSSIEANFTGIASPADGKIYINRVIHQTYINVDGKGTKAGAATIVEMNCESAEIGTVKPKQVHLTRPFVYMLIDCETNMPFFIGTMMNIEG